MQQNPFLPCKRRGALQWPANRGILGCLDVNVDIVGGLCCELVVVVMVVMFVVSTSTYHAAHTIHSAPQLRHLLCEHDHTIELCHRCLDVEAANNWKCFTLCKKAH